MPITWSDRMDSLLVRTIGLFGRTVSYRRTGYASFDLTGILDIDPRLESVDLGKYYAVTLRLKDFESAPFAAAVTLRFTGAPGAGNTITFDGVTYTFRNTLGAPENEVLRATTALECAAALTAAINATPIYSGTYYSVATVAHPTCKATQDSESVRVEYRTAGIAGNNKVATEALYNASLSSKLFIGGGPMKSDEATIDGLDYKVGDVGYDAEGGVTLRLHVKDTAAA